MGANVKKEPYSFYKVDCSLKIPQTNIYFFPGIDYNRRYNLVIIYKYSHRIYLQRLLRYESLFGKSKRKKGPPTRGGDKALYSAVTEGQV